MQIHRSLVVVAALFAVATLATCSLPASAQQNQRSTSPAGPQVSMTVSVEPRHGNEVPVITREDIVVEEGHDHDMVTKWVPAQGANSGLELLILMDDSSGFSVDTQLQDLRAFINQLPPTTFVGVGYIQNGTVEMVQNFTQDHASAAKSLRLSLGAGAGTDASPYISLTDYVEKHWPVNSARPRREVLMMTDGVDTYYGGGPDDPYVDNAVAGAQRLGLIIYSIYTPGSGHAGHSFFLNNWGQNYLSEIAEKTGGESYWEGFGAAVSFAPYLNQFLNQLQHQYLLTFVPKPEKKAGLQRIRLATEIRDVELHSLQYVFVPATPD